MHRRRSCEEDAAERPALREHAGSVGVSGSLGEVSTTLPAMSSFQRNKWVGRWSMSHDGWKGRLYIDRIGSGSNPNAVIGRYQDQSGQWRPLHGTIASSKPSIALIGIDMGSGNLQPFSLYYHLRDDGRFSGVTTWAGSYFGVTAILE